MRRPATFRLGLILAAGLLAGPVCPGQPRPGTAQALRQAIDQAATDPARDRLAERLGALATDESRHLLLDLLADPALVRRQSAVRGLARDPHPAVDPPLVRAMVADPYLRREIDGLLRRRLPGNLTALQSVVPELTRAEHRSLVFGLIAAAGTEPAARYLADRVAAEGPGRAEALAALAGCQPAAATELARRHATDPALTLTALDLLLISGQAGDLALYRPLLTLAPGRSAAHFALACRAVERWADPAEQAAVLRAALLLDDPRARAALVTLRGLADPGVRAGLTRLIGDPGRPSATRLLAADRLAEVADRGDLPGLLPALRLEYEPRERTFIDTLGAVLTAGLRPVIQAAAAYGERRAFEAGRARVAERVGQLAGVQLGEDADAWQEWAVCQGMTVAGDNLVRRLTRPSPAATAADLDCACRLLGYRDVAEYRQRHPDLAEPGPDGLAGQLARRLVAAGQVAPPPSE